MRLVLLVLPSLAVPAAPPVKEAPRGFLWVNPPWARSPRHGPSPLGISFGEPPPGRLQRPAKVKCTCEVRAVMKVRGATYTYVIRRAEEGGYTARCVELPQVHTEGETQAEAKRNMRDALSLAVDYLRERARNEKGQLLEITIP